MDQIPRLADLLAPCVDALLSDLTGERRAAREHYANHGRYGDILRGWRGQAEVIRARLSKEVLATRLDSCGGPELRDLAHSEYFAELPTDPQKAVGEAVLTRSLVNTSATPTGNFAAGVIPAGTKLRKAGEPNAQVPSKDAEYVTIESVACGADDTATVDAGGGNWSHTQDVTVPLEATREGPHANRPLYFAGITAPTKPTVSSVLFDSFLVKSWAVAGGTLGVLDDQLRALSRAMATGSAGPTSRAAIAGTLTNPGARRAVYVDDPAAAIGRLFVADESWASSVRYRDLILRSLRTKPWIGWGCRISVERIANYAIVAAPSVLLRSREYEPYQSDISANITKALVAYFDDRADWYTWTLNAIGAVVGGADSRILACTAVSIRGADDSPFAAVDEFGVITGTEPSSTPVYDPGSSIAHYSLVGNAVSAIYSTPGG